MFNATKNSFPSVYVVLNLSIVFNMHDDNGLFLWSTKVDNIPYGIKAIIWNRSDHSESKRSFGIKAIIQN